MSSQEARYSTWAVSMHWLMAVLVLTAFATGLEGRDAVIFSDAMLLDRQIHESLGLVVFALLWLRLVIRLLGTSPKSVASARWMHVAGKVAQGFLYLLMIGVPLLGIVGLGSESHTVELLGGFSFAPNWHVEVDLLSWHKTMGDAILWLAGLHAFAALFHHFVLRDSTLVAMLPQFVSNKLPGAR